MKSPVKDSMVVQDRSGRRKFIRTGSAFLLAGGSLAHLHSAYGDECDRVPDEKNPKQAGNGSDSDEGAEADAPGCGRQNNPKITRLQQPKESVSPVKVVKT